MSLYLGSSGIEVGRLHQLLLEAGESIGPGELRNQLFGATTRIAVMNVQAQRVEPNGRPLKIDGEAGPKTIAALRGVGPKGSLPEGWVGNVAAASPRIQPVVAAAIGELGVTEKPVGSNDGPGLKKYQIGSDPKTGKKYPWCSYFVSWAWAHYEGGSPFGTKASALKIRDWGALHGRLIGSSIGLQPGDLTLMIRPSGSGHVELVVAPEEFGRPISAIGGNVSQGVRGTIRERSTFTAVVRPIGESPLNHPTLLG